MLDFGSSSCFFLGSAVVGASGLCGLQGFLIQFFGLSAIVWNGCIAHNLYHWVVLRDNQTHLIQRLRYYLIGTLSFSSITTLVAAGAGKIGPTKLWCWIEDSSWHIPAFYLFLFIVVTFNLVIFVRVQQEVAERLQGADDKALAKITRKLRHYLLAFIGTWFWGIVNRLNTIAHPDDPYHFGLALLHVIFVPLQGFFNAIIYGGLHKPVKRKWREWRSGRRDSRGLVGKPVELREIEMMAGNKGGRAIARCVRALPTALPPVLYDTVVSRRPVSWCAGCVHRIGNWLVCSRALAAPVLREGFPPHP